ncbi:MAG: hypothetical protein V3T86_06750 [Planctomycetota bacterium]
MSEPQARLSDQQLLVLRLLLVAPMVGAYFAIAVVLFLGISLESKTDWIVQGYALYAAIAFIVGGLPLQFVLGRSIDTRLSRRVRDGASTEEGFFGAYRTKVVISAVLTELMVFGVLAAHVLTGRLMLLWIASVVPITGLSRLPTLHGFENWCANVRERARD